MSESAIQTEWDDIDRYLGDVSRRRQYELEEKAERDYVSDMEGAREEGEFQGILRVAKKLAQKGMPLAQVAEIVGLPIHKIKEC